MKERLAFLFVNLVGTMVQVEMRNGEIYEGIFHANNLDKGGSGVALKMAKKLRDEMHPENVISDFLAEGSNIVQVIAKDVDIGFASGGILSDRAGFQTDTDISGAGGKLQERELKPWTPDNADSTALSNLGDLSLDKDAKGRGAWDQFRVNEKLFGVKSDYDEAMYTTSLDRNSEEYKKRERQAEKLAKEIEGSETSNIHVAEERGKMVDDGLMNEEDRYGAVVRNPGSYVPPPVRKKEVSDKDLDNPSEKSSELPKKTSFNPNAPSFEFKISATEFKPSAPAAQEFKTTENSTSAQPGRARQYSTSANNIFNKRVKHLDNSVRALLRQNFYRSFRPRNVANIGPLWPWGQKSHLQMFQHAMMVDQMAMGFGFGSNQTGFPVNGMQMMQPQYISNPYMGAMPMGYPMFVPMMPASPGDIPSNNSSKDLN